MNERLGRAIHLIVVVILTAGLTVLICFHLQGNQPPLVSISADVTCGIAPLKVSFTSEVHDPDGEIEKYLWDFGDGHISNKKNPTHTYYWRGTFYAQLMVWDDSGNTVTEKITINILEYSQPIAFASANTTYGKIPLKISFSGSGKDFDGEIESYYWEFGDGSTSHKQNPTHTYDTVGKFFVHLTVTDNDGEIGIDVLEINVVPNCPPTAQIIADVTKGPPPLKVTFEGVAEDIDGWIVSYKWEFENTFRFTNPEGNKQSVTYTYFFPGTYTVKLTVKDNDGAIGMDFIVITVEQNRFLSAISDVAATLKTATL